MALLTAYEEVLKFYAKSCRDKNDFSAVEFVQPT